MSPVADQVTSIISVQKHTKLAFAYPTLKTVIRKSKVQEPVLNKAHTTPFHDLGLAAPPSWRLGKTLVGLASH